MNDQVRKAAEQLFGACLALSEGGKYHAFLYWSPHVSSVDVDVFSMDTQFVEGGLRPRVLEASITLSGPHAESADVVAKQLESLTGKLNSLLMEDAA